MPRITDTIDDSATHACPSCGEPVSCHGRLGRPLLASEVKDAKKIKLLTTVVWGAEGPEVAEFMLQRAFEKTKGDDAKQNYRTAIDLIKNHQIDGYHMP